jgi:hypothetical protein
MEPLRPRDLSDLSHLRDASAVDLVRSALAETKNLVALEMALAKDEAKRELYAARRAAIAAAVAFSMLLVAASVLLVSLALAIAPGAFPALVIGVVALGVAAFSAWLATRFLPKKPLIDTRERLGSDLVIVKEHIV